MDRDALFLFGNGRKGYRLQSAVEYLTTYGWALIILAIILSLLYFFILAPSTIAPSSCTFGIGVSCKDIIFGSGSSNSIIVALLSNSQEYALRNINMSANLTGIGVYKGKCAPYYVLPGGTIICNVTIPSPVTVGTLKSGSLYVNATVCRTISTAGCESPQQQLYVGSFNAHTVPSFNKPTVEVSLSASNYNPLANGAKDQLIANVKMLGYPVSGATVNFSYSGVPSTLYPKLSPANSNGDALSDISSTNGGKVTVSAGFSGYNSMILLNFVPAVYLTFQTNEPNTGQTEVTISSVKYINLPVTLSFAQGTQVPYAYASTIPVSGTERYAYVSVSGCSLSVQSGTANAIANCTATADYQTQYYLSTAANPAGTGTVSLSPNTQSNWYNTGSSVQATATPGTGYQFLSWSGSGTGSYTGSSNPATVVMDGPTTETANFQLIPESFTETANPSAGGTVSPGSGTYSYGSSITLGETPATGYEFTGWTCSGPGCYSGTSTNPTITITGPTTETANFQLIPESFTETANPSAGGTVSPGSGTYSYGSSITLGETPATGYEFTGWTCSGPGCYSGTSASPTITITGPTVETAAFQLLSESLDTSASPSTGGTVSPGSGTYSYGTQVTVTQSASAGYGFSDWVVTTGSGMNTYTTSTVTVTMDSPVTVVAEFTSTLSTTSTTVSTTTSVSGGGGGSFYTEWTSSFGIGGVENQYYSPFTGCSVPGCGCTPNVAESNTCPTPPLTAGVCYEGGSTYPGIQCPVLATGATGCSSESTSCSSNPTGTYAVWGCYTYGSTAQGGTSPVCNNNVAGTCTVGTDYSAVYGQATVQVSCQSTSTTTASSTTSVSTSTTTIPQCDSVSCTTCYSAGYPSCTGTCEAVPNTATGQWYYALCT